MLILIGVVTMAFATVDLKPGPKMVTGDDSYATMYIRVNNAWHTIEVECGEGTSDCLVTFSEDPSSTIYQVYNSQSLADPAKGTGDVKVLDGPPPSN